MFELFQSSSQNKTNFDSLVYICLSSITNLSKQKFTSPILNAYLGRGSLVGGERTAICSKQCNFTVDRWTLAEQGLTLCQKGDYLQLQLCDEERVCGSMKFPLEQMLAMPRVTHEIELLLLKYQKWDSLDRSPLKNTAQVDLSLMAMNKQLGKFVITSVEVELTRNTSLLGRMNPLLGRMNPYVQFRLDEEVKQTSVRQNVGMHSIWHEQIQFHLKDVNKSFNLQISVLDKDNLNISSFVVGKVKIDLIKQRMLIPQEEILLRGFTLMFDDESAGRIKLEFQFKPKQFNF